MACWVVPAIAAELWGVTVNHVLAGIRDGSIEARHEHGFVFVDVAPGSHIYHRPRRPDEPAPATFVLIPPSEAAEPSQQPSTEPEADFVWSEQAAPPPEAPPPLAWIAPEAVQDDELPPLDEEEDNTPLPPRDAVRAAVARQRRRPLAA